MVLRKNRSNDSLKIHNNPLLALLITFDLKGDERNREIGKKSESSDFDSAKTFLACVKFEIIKKYNCHVFAR